MYIGMARLQKEPGNTTTIKKCFQNISVEMLGFKGLLLCYQGRILGEYMLDTSRFT